MLRNLTIHHRLLLNSALTLLGLLGLAAVTLYMSYQAVLDDKRETVKKRSMPPKAPSCACNNRSKQAHSRVPLPSSKPGSWSARCDLAMTITCGSMI